MRGANLITDFQLLPENEGLVRITTADGTEASHSFVDNQWIIGLTAAGSRSSIELESWREAAGDTVETTHSRTGEQHEIALANGHRHQWLLGEAHYLRTDESWEEAGQPTASVELFADAAGLHIVVDALTGPIVVPSPDFDNPLDNERADVNADGVQLYFGTRAGAPWTLGWLIVPSTPVRTTPLVAGQQATPDVSWVKTGSGWRMMIHIPQRLLPAVDGRIVFDLVVNERPAHRERRRGQLVLSHGSGFSYLRGDRHDSSRAFALRLA